MPAGFGQMLTAADFIVRGPTELVLAGNDGDADLKTLESAAWRTGIPNLIVTHAGPDGDGRHPTAAGRGMVDGKATAYVCRSRACSSPVHDAEALSALLRQ